MENTVQKAGLTYDLTLEGGKNITRNLEEVIDVTKDMWETNRGVKIISLKGLQKIQAFENIVEKDFRTEIVPLQSNNQQHVINIWLGFKGDANKDNWVRGSGEASTLNTGKRSGGSYDEVNSIDSQFRYAMAEKRALARAMLKFIKLRGVYSEVEAIDFTRPSTTATSTSDIDF